MTITNGTYSSVGNQNAGFALVHKLGDTKPSYSHRQTTSTQKWESYNRISDKHVSTREKNKL